MGKSASFGFFVVRVLLVLNDSQLTQLQGLWRSGFDSIPGFA